MNNFQKIERKLHSFYKKYYLNLLLKGVLLFLAFGLTYFLVTSFVEYSFWLPPMGRTFLFWLFVFVEVVLLVRLIAIPLIKLLKASRGIGYTELSRIVGTHFKEVEDKLLNVLQLKASSESSDLLLASIEQKSKELVPIPFNKAISFKANLKYVKFVLAPFVIIILLFFTNLVSDFSKSFQRVLNYKTAYTPPAPFEFLVLNQSLNTIEGKDFVLKISTKGQVIPKEAKVHFDGQEYYLRNTSLGEFEFTFPQLQKDVEFFIEANEIRSESLKVHVLNTPRINEITLDIQYPSYTLQKDKKVQSSPSLIVPEGTFITWNIATENTDKVDFISKNERIPLQKQNQQHSYSKKATNSFRYQIATTNENVEDFEKIGFSVNVVKDAYPKIEVESNIDSLNTKAIYFVGQVSDDYLVRKLHLVYQIEGNSETRKTHSIPIKKESLQSFYYDFPTGLDLKEGLGYELYFEVFDNDGVNGSKKTKSRTFLYRVQTQKEKEQKVLESQKDQINKLEKSLLDQRKEKKALQEIQQDLQNKQEMNWNDKEKLDNLVKRQEQYQQMMEKQTNNLLQNLDEKKEEDPYLQNNKEELKKRIEELKKLKKQQKLLEELDKLADKLNKEEIIRKTKELAEQNKQQERSLERILELTKRFYVEQKMTQLANKLNELSDEQNKSADKDTPSQEEQREITKKFDDIEKELEQLDKDNEDLKSPMDVPDLSDEQYEVNKEQKEAQKNIDQKNNSEAKKNQKKASKMMKQMSQKMMQAMMDMQANSIEENADNLRKILKNLITFSFQQETLMKKFEEIDFQHPSFGKNLKKQNELKTYFEHIDDSLYVLSMRVPQISTKLQNDLADAHYNLDESLENFAERRFNNGTSNQQYVMTSANNISDFLSDLLNNMNNSMSASGKGKSSNSFSLPTLIQKQKGLSEQMKKSTEGQQQKGQKQKGQEKNGKREGNNREESNGELYQIYQQQSQLKQQLQSLIEQGGDKQGLGKKVIKSMEQLENEILEKGFSKDVLQRMKNLEYELLKLEDAALEQNKDKKRKSNTNTLNYSKKKLQDLQIKKLYYNQLEILNRQSLPLQQNYKKKVQEYFSKKVKD